MTTPAALNIATACRVHPPASREIIAWVWSQAKYAPPSESELGREVFLTYIPGCYGEPAWIAITINGSPQRGTLLIDTYYRTCLLLVGHHRLKGKALYGHGVQYDRWRMAVRFLNLILPGQHPLAKKLGGDE